ncbi:MAG: PTS glucose transporter subunit IIA [Lachnospiraceae bacterium]|jgi:PTS system beta-glucosides-specific IIC component|nr:PTS glucose transporter subunit IIA [Lachnospiraceae bacterium]MDE6815895.1 PTS glucose transporter subunit IIA [Lachnospiraceae bacterium]
MKLFQGLFGKNDGIRLVSPTDGKLVSIKEVSDPTFSEEILGKGVAVIPSDGKFCAPADGTVTTVFPTGHAAAVTTEEGVEVLIHIGLDTVKLDGKHFTIRTEEGKKVKAGDVLIEADLEKIKEEGYDIITPVIICNSDDFSSIEPEAPAQVGRGDYIVTLKK